MKRIVLTMAAAAIAASSVMAQVSTTDLNKAVNDAKAKIAKSDAEIQDAKKGIASKTWDNRGKVFSEAYTAPSKNITPGTPTNKETNPLYNLEMLVGAPSEKKADKDFTIWVYPTCNVYVQNDVVQFTQATNPADAKALEKAVEAYRKAAELDPKGAYKNSKSAQNAIQNIRKNFQQEGVAAYLLNDYDKAAYYFEQAVSLNDFDIPAGDTTFNQKQVTYNAALCAYHSKHTDKAKKIFEQCIKENYQLGSCYQYIYTIMKENGQEQEGIKVIKAAYEKNPSEINILYTLIDAYAGQKQYADAIEYLDKAIANDPEKVILYNVKAGMYKGMSQDSKTAYIDGLSQISSLKKEAFRARNNAAELAAVNAKLDAAKKANDDNKAKFLELQNKAEKCYQTSISKDAKNFDAIIGAAELYNFDQAVVIDAEKSSIPLSEDKDGKLSDAKDKELKAAFKKAADYYEKAYSVKPTDQLPLQNLKSLYYKLGDTENNKRVKDLLEKM